MSAHRALIVLLALALLIPLLAIAGTFVTKEGKTYLGEAVIETQDKIVVRTETGIVELEKRDLLHLSEAELNAHRLLYLGKRAKAEADKAYLLDDLGKAAYYWDASLAALASIDPGMEKQFALGEQLIRDVKASIEKLEATLEERGLAAYKGQLFEKGILDYHLSQGHVLSAKGIWTDPSQVCDGCQGTGWVQCEPCSGTGLVSVRCPDCRNGRIPNPRGNGTGKAVCHDCGGDGKRTVRCSRCAGSGEVICPNCRGSGTKTERCPRCNGKGEIVTRIRAYDNWGNVIWVKARTTCTQCGGRGRVEVVCRVCDGDGKIVCPRCRGSGKGTVRCRSCAGRGYIVVPTTVPCPRCHGTGWLQKKCEACAGRGSRTCPDCGGKGYTGNPCPDPGPPESGSPEKEVSSDDATTVEED